MAKRKHQIKVSDLARLMVYVLGHRPGEFGLVPDAEGYLAFKELLKGIHEEPGWGYVKQSHIHEVLMGKDRDLFQWDEKRIKARERRWDWKDPPSDPGVPKILYAPVRRRAHAHVLEKGLKTSSERPIVLSRDRDMAVRIGRRRDPDPVILEIMASRSEQSGHLFSTFQDLFLADEIPADHIAGPPLPKESVRTPPEEQRKKPVPSPGFQAGTFILNMDHGKDGKRKSKGRKQKGWKEAARKYRKSKTR